MPTWRGSCHCGAVEYDVTGEPFETTQCDCSLCRRRNAVMIQVPEAGLRILKGEDALTLYRWNTGVARHYFCGACGVYVFHRKRSAPDSWGVNVFCLEGFDPEALPRRQADGKTMTVEAEAPRDEWTGPRV